MEGGSGDEDQELQSPYSQEMDRETKLSKETKAAHKPAGGHRIFLVGSAWMFPEPPPRDCSISSKGETPTP